MLGPKVGLVIVASFVESGGERADTILNSAKIRLSKNGLNVVEGKRVIWSLADAIEVAEYLSLEKIDTLVIIHATWISDAIQYILVNTIKASVVLWGIPFIETFSIPSVQHFSSVLWERKICHKYVYGLPEDKEVINSISDFSLTAKVYRDLQDAKVALIGPRQTFRVAGTTDMTSEEWDITKLFGSKIIHVEMDELLSIAKKKTDSEAGQVLQNMKQQNRLGKVQVRRERLLFACKIYLGLKDLYTTYKLTGATAECYPNYNGITNLPAAWLADEGFTMETEGDVGHTILMIAMCWLGRGGAVALTETGKLDYLDNYIWVAHEGSTALSLAENPESIHILEGGKDGTVVGFPMKPIEEITVASLVGRYGTYRMFIGKCNSEAITEIEWKNAGQKLVAKLNFNCNIMEVFKKMIDHGIDHHLLLKEGDIINPLSDLCDLLGINKVIL